MIDHNKSNDVPVSVVIPVFNAEKWIGDCIDSVLKQTCLPAEIIAVNDGSTDKTIEILNQNYASAARLKVIHQTNKGPAVARNRGIFESTQPFIAFLDSDDIWLPGKLCRQIKLLKSAGEEYGLCHTFAEIIDEFGKIKKTWEDLNLGSYYFNNFNEITSEVLARGNYVVGSGSSVLIRRQCIADVGIFDEDPYAVEDWYYWYRLSLRYKILTVPEVLVQIRSHRNAMHASHKKRIKRQLFTIQKMMQLCPKEHYDILKQSELRAAATLLFRSLPDITTAVKLFRKYELSLINASFKKIASWTKHNLLLFVYKVKALLR